MPSLDPTVFDELTEQSAYWLGFLLADGSLYFPKKWGTPTLDLCIQEKDRKHLEAFREFLGSTHKIGYRPKHKAVRLAVRHAHLTEKLQDWGIIPNKTQHAKVHLRLQHNRDFWRGMIDGDGCIYRGNFVNSISLCGTEAVCSAFRDFVGTENKIHFHNGAHYYYVCGVEASKLARKLYTRCATALPRKRELAETWF